MVLTGLLALVRSRDQDADETKQCNGIPLSNIHAMRTNRGRIHP